MLPLFDNYRRRRTAAVTLLLIAINLAAFTYQILLYQQGALEEFIRQYAFIPAALVQDPSWERGLTVLTSMFLHGGWLHLLANTWFLWLFGNSVEDRLGPFRYLLLYLLSGAGAAAAQFAAGPTSGIPMVGASGAIAGILGAYLFLFPTGIIFTFVPIWFAPILPVPAFVFLVLWFLLQIWHGIASFSAAEPAGGIAWWAHFGGFIAGLLLIRKLRKR